MTGKVKKMIAFLCSLLNVGESKSTVNQIELRVLKTRLPRVSGSKLLLQLTTTLKVDTNGGKLDISAIMYTLTENAIYLCGQHIRILIGSSVIGTKVLLMNFHFTWEACTVITTT